MIATRYHIHKRDVHKLDVDETQMRGHAARTLCAVSRWISAEPSHGRVSPAVEDPAP